MIPRVISAIHIVNEKAGQYVSYLFIPLTAVCVIEVTMRYVFNRPTIWAWDVERQLFGVITVVGAGYTLLHGAHVSIDIFMVRFPSRFRAGVKLLTTGLSLLTALIVIQQVSLSAIDSVKMREVSSSYWVYRLYPIRIAIAIGVILLFFQLVAQFILTLKDYRELPHLSHQKSPQEER